MEITCVIHGDSRMSPKGYCLECNRLKSRAWRAANLVRARELDRRVYWRNIEGKAVWHKNYKARHRQSINAAEGERKKAIRLRTPKWADRSAIKKIYDCARELREQTGTNIEVDHIIPLRGKNVSGLHIAENLQISSGMQNRMKFNHA